MPATAGKFARSVGRVDPDRFDEFVAASAAAVVKSLQRLLAKHYAEPAHLRADVKQIATRAMSKSLDNDRPNGIGTSAEARRKRVERNTLSDRPTDPKAVVSVIDGDDGAKSIDIDPRDAAPGPRQYPSDPIEMIYRLWRAEFAEWFPNECDRLAGDWTLWEAITLIQCQPAFGIGRERRPNITALARYLRRDGDSDDPEVLARRLARRLAKLGCEVAGSCSVAEYHEVAEEILGFLWIRATEIGRRLKDKDSGEAA